MKILKLAIVVFSFLFTSHAYATYVEQADNSGLKAALGQGWSNDNNALAGPCLLVGDKDYVGTPSSSLELDNVYTYEDVKKQLNLDIDGKLTLAGYGISASAKFAHDLEDTSYSQTFTYRANVKLKNVQYLPPQDKNPLSWFGQYYAKDPEGFRIHCGDKFIAQQELGGALYIAAKFLFHTESDKETFKASMKVGKPSLFELQGGLNSLSSAIEKRGKVEVIAYQVGGNVARLGEIFGVTTKGGPSMMQCSLDKLTKCADAIDRMLAYAADSSNGGFPTQFDKDDPNSPDGPAALKNIVNDYQYVAPVTVGKSLLTPAIIEARGKLSYQYQLTVKQASEIHSLLNNGRTYSASIQQALQSAQQQVEINQSLIRNATQACHTGDLSACVSTADQALASIKPVNIPKV